MKFGSHINATFKMNCIYFGDARHFSLSNNLVYDQIPSKLLALPLASVVLSIKHRLDDVAKLVNMVNILSA